MKFVTMSLAVVLAGIGSAAEAQTVLARYDNIGQCLSAYHRAINEIRDSERGTRDDGDFDRWEPRFGCWYNGGYYYLITMGR